MKDTKFRFLLQTAAVCCQKFQEDRLCYLKAAVNAGDYIISSDRVAEDFLADQWLYLYL